MKKTPKKHYSTALSIAGFDGSAGAGIQADIKTFSALGCYGLTVLTALPIQNTQGVQSIYDISEKCVEEQATALLTDIAIDAIKIGMLHRKEVIETVINILKKHVHQHVVLDPVLAASKGEPLLTFDAIECIKKNLFPLTSLITPNLPEASIFLGREIKSKNQMEQAALQLVAMGPQAVLLKGGHLTNENCDDCLCIHPSSPEILWFSSPKIATKNTHGTGCTYSAAITAFLAKGYELIDAIKMAKDYMFHCLSKGSNFILGRGNGPLHHFHEFW